MPKHSHMSLHRAHLNNNTYTHTHTVINTAAIVKLMALYLTTATPLVCMFFFFCVCVCVSSLRNTQTHAQTFQHNNDSTPHLSAPAKAQILTTYIHYLWRDLKMTIYKHFPSNLTEFDMIGQKERVKLLQQRGILLN